MARESRLSLRSNRLLPPNFAKVIYAAPSQPGREALHFQLTDTRIQGWGLDSRRIEVVWRVGPSSDERTKRLGVILGAGRVRTERERERVRVRDAWSAASDSCPVREKKEVGWTLMLFARLEGAAGAARLLLQHPLEELKLNLELLVMPRERLH